jgi:hypothetical protein
MKKTPKYYAFLRFADGQGASATDNNLARLRNRIKRGFAGETTDWGYPGPVTVAGWAIFREGDRLEESEDFRG